MIPGNYQAPLQRIAARLGVPAPGGQGVDQFWPFLERMRRDGAVALLKLDGERREPGDTGPYTALVSGGPLHGEHFRTDAHTAEEALAFIIVRYFDAVPE